MCLLLIKDQKYNTEYKKKPDTSTSTEIENNLFANQVS